MIRDDDTNFPNKLLLTNRQVVSLSKIQISKEDFLVDFLAHY